VHAGDGYAIQVRGPSTFYGSAEPLIVIDGMPLTQGAGGLELLHPRDVARIEVLKDAGDTALYGVRGANGVIVITTRRARQ
jgi:TonB-dependent SusC/RagA subfamily outer membrane receptor